MKTTNLLTTLLCMLFAVGSAYAADFTYEEDMVVGASYEGKPINVATADILTSIGASAISDVKMYAIKADGTRTEDYRHDGINADGWRKADGTFTNWGVESVYYVQPDHNTGVFVVGAFPGAITEPKKIETEFVYVNNSTSAEAVVKIVLNYKNPEATVMKTLDLPIYITPAVAYEGGNEVTFDLADAISTLGVEKAGDITAFIYQSDDTYVPNTTDGWRNAEGFAAGWASSASMVCCKADIAGGRFFDIMAIDGNYAKGSTYTAKWILIANLKAIVYNINITFDEDPAKKDVNTFTCVKTIYINHIEEANKAYDTEGEAPTFSVAEVCEALGIDDISKAETYIMNVTDDKIVKNSTDGWRDANGDAAAWGAATDGFCLKLENPASGAFNYSAAHDYNFNPGDSYVAKWVVANMSTDKYVVLQLNITFAAKASATLAVTDAKYGTFIAPFDVALPAGVSAYKAEGIGADNVITLTEVSSIKACVPYVVYAESSVSEKFSGWSFTTANEFTEGLLTGVYSAISAPVGSYVLQNQDGKVGFYHVEDVLPTVAANRCYLTAPAGTEAKAIFFDNATAISAIEALASGKAEIYNLNGVKLNGLQKGINIVNGVKVLVK